MTPSKKQGDPEGEPGEGEAAWDSGAWEESDVPGRGRHSLVATCAWEAQQVWVGTVMLYF